MRSAASGAGVRRPGLRRWLPWLGLLGCLLAAPAMAHDTVYYYYTDSLHSAVVETDAQGQVLERTYYGPYGQVLDRSLRDGPGYTGHEEDPATGLNYLQQRYYDPQSGRFLSPDPVQATSDGGNFNRYWYANDNPYRYTDPFGLQTTGEAIDAAAEGCGPVSCAGWGILKAVYTATGAEAVSRVTDKGWSSSSTGDKVRAAIAVAAVLPVGRAVEGVEDAAKAANAARAASEVAEAAMGADQVAGVLNGLEAGRSSGVNVIGSAHELKGLFTRLTAGGKVVEGSKYPGRMIELPDGTTIGLRSTSKSGGPTIDIHFPDDILRKVHVKP